MKTKIIVLMRKIKIFFIKFAYYYAKKNYEHHEVFHSEREWILFKWYLLRKIIKINEKNLI
jgi:hypothetical protein